MSIKRYAMSGHEYVVYPSLSGVWVTYDDHVAEVERVTADLAAARAERDGLAKALAAIAQDQDSDWPEEGPGERVPLHEADEMVAMARAALAALPKEDDRG